MKKVKRVGCKRRSPETRLVMVNVVCSLRKDMLQPYEQAIDYTPNLARFAEKSLVFENHVTESGQSGISFASILTGQHSMRHQVYAHPARLPDAIQTLPEVFAKAGYETFYWEHQSMASVELNYGQGVEPANAFANRALRADDPKFIAVLKRLAEDPSYKALIVSFDSSLAHAPYKKDSLDGFCARYPHHCRGVNPAKADLFYQNWLALSYNFPETSQRLDLAGADLKDLINAVELIYKSRVYYTDQVFGELVDVIERFGLSKESVVAFTADHGETLYRESSLFKWSHGFELAPEVINVPLLVKAPSLRPARYREISRSVDVLPTLAALAGVDIDDGNALLGRDLVSSRHGRERRQELAAFSHTGMWPPVGKRWWLREPLLLKYHPSNDPERMWVSLRVGDLVLKYRSADTGELFYEAFDIRRDPNEERNIFDPHNPTHQDLVHQLSRYRKALIDGYIDRHEETPQRPRPEDPKLIEQLRALGYIE